MKPSHIPVMLDQVIQVLSPKRGECYLDCTAGYGGHAAAVAEKIGSKGRMILVDRDVRAVQALGEQFGDRAEIMHASFLEAAEQLSADGTLVDIILLDLGVSSPQLDDSRRGFSFKSSAPLDMRMDQTQPRTAETVVNRMKPKELERILREYGEEPRAKAVAQAIVRARPITTTAKLAEVVRRAAARSEDIDPATRTFQAVRIEVNQELQQLAQALPLLTRILAPGGRIGVISFHSLEDRIVKQYFDRESRDCICPPKQPVCTCEHVASVIKITTKPLMADQKQIASNPRARSAKLRAAEKINKNKRRD